MEKQTFDHLVRLAQQEPHPDVNVADDVLSILTAMANRQSDPYRAYTWIGAASAAIAACILIVSTIFWQSDSVSEIMTYVSWVAQ